METRIVKVPSDLPLGNFVAPGDASSRLERWEVDVEDKQALAALQDAAKYLREKDIPVAFPTETVYGLAADATRSSSVKGIYEAKGRPSDNPLIIHVPDLEMLRDLLKSPSSSAEQTPDTDEDLIPEKYRPLIERFWPGPLTILLPNPQPSKLAPEVTAGLSTFGVRMPSSTLALSLIKLSQRPLAAPSANASTKPSPTTAHHVQHDLGGRIELILDGGPCEVGVESTVVDGLCDPPVVLRPGGVGIDELRSCPGWENVTKAYQDATEIGKDAPRAPGMKYKHYSPKARVVLYEASYAEGDVGVTPADYHDLVQPETNGITGSEETQAINGHDTRIVGVIRTRRWHLGAGLKWEALHRDKEGVNGGETQDASYAVDEGTLLDQDGHAVGKALDIDLGKDTRSIAQGLFSALRELDERGAEVIFVDGIDDSVDIAGAVMNRLRKAASEIRT
jgi:L-threonylcarbamoyladenylate synthase